MRMTHPGPDRALIYTFTVGLIVPALAVVWLASVLAIRPVPAGPRPAVVATAPPVSVRSPLATEVHSQWVSQSGPATILVDGIAEFTMVFRNVGSVPWVKGSPSEARLGIVGDDPAPAEAGYAVNWPLPTRVAVQSEPVVAPGARATFTFIVRGQSSGRLVIRVRPVIDGVTWLEDEGAHVELIVGAVSFRAGGT